MGLQACFNLVDLFIIGSLPNGALAIGALAICDMVAVLGTILTQGISNASVAVVSRFVGREDRPATNHAIWSSIFIVALLSLVFGAVGLFAADLLVGDMVGASGDVRRVAVSYLVILVGNSWTIFFLLHLTALMRALGDAKWPAIILIGANVLNVFLDAILVYGPGPAPSYFHWATVIASDLGIPRMGVDGAAWATVIARAIGCLVAMSILFSYKTGPRVIWEQIKPKTKELWRLIRIGTPSSAQYLVRIAAVLVCLSLVARNFDEDVLSAFGLCIRLDMLALFTGMGWASAAATYVGMNLGGKNPKRAIKAGWIAAAFNAVAMVILAGLYLNFSGSILGIWFDQPNIITIGEEYLWAVSWTYLFLGIGLALSHAFQGAADTMTSFVLDAIVIVGLQIPFLIVVVSAFDLPQVWLWYTIAGANVLSAIIYAVWYHRGRWTHRQV